MGGVDIEVEAVLRTNHVASVVAKVVLIFNLEIDWLISSILFGFQTLECIHGVLSILNCGQTLPGAVQSRTPSQALGLVGASMHWWGAATAIKKTATIRKN